MAYKHYIEDATSEVYKRSYCKTHFWNLTSNVGWGCENRKDDVQLVQYLLRAITYHVPSSLLPGQKPIAMDGVFGPHTNSFIRSFQWNWCNTPIDGKVQTSDGIHFYAKNSSPLVIHSLNKFYYMPWLEFYSDLRMDFRLPSVLCQSLSEWY